MKLATLTGGWGLEQASTAQLAREVALVGGFALATGLAAHVRLPLPFTVVPLTLQTLVVLVAGGVLGMRRGALSQMVYLLLAASGLPLIAGPTLFGPTGGYLLGFLAAAMLMGWAAARPSAARLLAGAAVSTLAIYACGVTWLCLTTGLGVAAGITQGAAPFVAGDVLKALAALGLTRALRR